jgi:hypothetical protein
LAVGSSADKGKSTAERTVGIGGANSFGYHGEVVPFNLKHPLIPFKGASASFIQALVPGLDEIAKSVAKFSPIDLVKAAAQRVQEPPVGTVNILSRKTNCFSEIGIPSRYEFRRRRWGRGTDICGVVTEGPVSLMTNGRYNRYF